jgi:hypothetical protein
MSEWRMVKIEAASIRYSLLAIRQTHSYPATVPMTYARRAAMFDTQA